MSSGSEDTEGESWVQWFCGLKGHEFFCEVERSYIEDGFNLYGLRNYVSNFQETLNVILDQAGDIEASDEDEEKTQSAMLLYGLIHARYIITSHGLHTMLAKFRNAEFGKCPRMHCWGQCVVPIGTSVEPQHDHVRIFCPRCGEVYTPTVNAGVTEPVDGAFFGPTFPHLFFMTFEEKPKESPQRFTPRVFGFRISPTSPSVAHLHLQSNRARAHELAIASGGNTGGAGGAASLSAVRSSPTAPSFSGSCSRTSSSRGVGGGGGGGGGSSGRGGSGLLLGSGDSKKRPSNSNGGGNGGGGGNSGRDGVEGGASRVGSTTRDLPASNTPVKQAAVVPSVPERYSPQETTAGASAESRQWPVGTRPASTDTNRPQSKRLRSS